MDRIDLIRSDANTTMASVINPTNMDISSACLSLKNLIYFLPSMSNSHPIPPIIAPHTPITKIQCTIVANTTCGIISPNIATNAAATKIHFPIALQNCWKLLVKQPMLMQSIFP